jgi:AraC-like DNA-binding protein
MKLFIRHMFSHLSKMVVKDELKKLDVQNAKVDLGVIEFPFELSDQRRKQLKDNLLRYGLELLDDRKRILIERVKNVIIEMIHYTDELPVLNYSHYISKRLGLDYTYLANTFSAGKGITIRLYIINQKIERAKEMLLCEGLSLTEISYKLNYSSVAHLSSQFKKVTGISPTRFKRVKAGKLVALEDV